MSTSASGASFAFVGKLSGSKSMLNRALLLQSYEPSIQISGDSKADDVQLMRQALQILKEKASSEIPVGSAGTVLRFMALRAAREPGQYTLKGEPRLFTRPQDELIKILKQLGVQAQLGKDRLEIEGAGWQPQGDTLLVPGERSSQFASSVLLNAWDLPFDLFVSQGGRRVSAGYWRMSVQMAQAQGLRIDFWDSDFRVPRGQRPNSQEIAVEIDMSSAFAIAAIAAVSGRASLRDFPGASLQPDAVFVDILERMGVPLTLESGALKVERAARLNGVAVNLKNAPDLFPVLAVLCALAEGESELLGASHLVYKESNRLARLAEWLKDLGREVQVKEDGLRILGERPLVPKTMVTALDSDKDHRLAFAGAILKAAGFPIEIRDSQVVSKSFPEFWSLLGWKI